jgi:hypothetical protein
MWYIATFFGFRNKKNINLGIEELRNSGIKKNN